MPGRMAQVFSRIIAAMIEMAIRECDEYDVYQFLKKL